jgi:hypothetical protein
MVIPRIKEATHLDPMHEIWLLFLLLFQKSFVSISQPIFHVAIWLKLATKQSLVYSTYQAF